MGGGVLRVCLPKERPMVLDQKMKFSYILCFKSLYSSSHRNAFLLTQKEHLIFYDLSKVLTGRSWFLGPQN